MIALYLFAALGLGAIISMQPAINAQMALRLGSPLIAAICSIVISLAMIVVVWTTLGRAPISLPKLFSLPWWVLIGGAAGALFVLGGIMVAPRLGVAAFFTCIVLGQVLGAAVLDQFGAFGLEAQPISWTRLLGIMFVVAGAAMTQVQNWLGS
ncbi:MAG: DMT family transporter [Rhizobiales bacterium]|nr:DMT family transporter [Hyphomicrobiales bacterium]